MHVNIGGQSLGKMAVDSSPSMGSQVKMSIDGVHNGSQQSPVMIHRTPAPRPDGIRAIGRGVKVHIGSPDEPEAMQTQPGMSQFPVIPLSDGPRPKVKIVIGPVDDEGNALAPQEPAAP